MLRGEAGVGSSGAARQHLAANAQGCRIARAVGVDSEMELAFAGCTSCAGRCPARALAGAAAGGAGHRLRPRRRSPAGPFPARAGGAHACSSDVADERPLLCIVDDAQWLDRASPETLAFVARRLLAESVALVFATARAGNELSSGLPEPSSKGCRRRRARAARLRRPRPARRAGAGPDPRRDARQPARAARAAARA